MVVRHGVVGRSFLRSYLHIRAVALAPRRPRTIHFISLSPPHAAARSPLTTSHTRTDVPGEGERATSVAGTSPLHPRLRVEPARRVAAAQQVVSRKGHLLAEEVEVVREAEVAS